MLLILATLLALLAGAAPASAAAYRYWSYWQGASGTWVAAQTGPGDYTVVDADVQGWRFGITTDSPTTPPDNAPDFAALCPQLAATPAAHATVRVAVVLDAGLRADAPQGQQPPADQVACVTVPSGSTGNQALAAATTVGQDGGMVCAIAGYPSGECGAEVSDAQAAAAAKAGAAEAPNPATATAAAGVGPTSSPSGSPAAFALGLVALLGVTGAAVVTARRRSRVNPGSPDA